MPTEYVTGFAIVALIVFTVGLAEEVLKSVRRNQGR